MMHAGLFRQAPIAVPIKVKHDSPFNYCSLDHILEENVDLFRSVFLAKGFSEIFTNKTVKRDEEGTQQISLCEQTVYVNLFV